MEFVTELKQIEVLQSEHILSIRKYIQKKYPTASTNQRSIILADAINKVIDEYIPFIVGVLFLSAVLLSYLFVVRQDNNVNQMNTTQANTIQVNTISKSQLSELQYRSVDKNRLLQYLSRKGSLLGEEPYFSAIIQASQEYDLNPLLLFAIAGQEQAYVPKNGKNTRLIANNPFNVYGSWQIYNTNILDSARIAANLIVTLSKNRPLSIDPLVWINRKYAEDKTWQVGVRKLLEELNKALIVKGSI